MNLVDKLSAEMKYSAQVQDDLYESIVIPSLDTEELPDAYQHYQNELGGFDIRAFRRCVESITQLNQDNPEEFANWSDKFTYIGEYATHRNAFDEKVKEIRQMDGTPSEKQAIFDTLDRNRTRAHNGVISLFNDLNDYATEHGIAQPYPTTQPFDKSNVIDRGKVADILALHETILETTNLVLESEKRVKSESERLRTMSLSQQLEFAKSRVLTATDLPDDHQTQLRA